MQNADGKDAFVAAVTFLGTGIRLEPDVPCAGMASFVQHRP